MDASEQLTVHFANSKTTPLHKETFISILQRMIQLRVRQRIRD